MAEQIEVKENLLVITSSKDSSIKNTLSYDQIESELSHYKNKVINLSRELESTKEAVQYFENLLKVAITNGLQSDLIKE